MRKNQVLIIAGYGGHAGYAYSVAWHLNQLGFTNNVVLVADEYRFLAERFKGLGRVEFMALPRRPGEAIYRGIHRWLKALFQSVKLLRGVDVGAVFASGSNFSIPPSLVSMLSKHAPLYTLEAIEHFTKRSRAVKILEKLGGRVFLHWDEQLELYPRGIVVGPVYEPRLYEPSNGGYVFVTTGTLGYRELFDAISSLNIERVVLQTGDIDPEPYIKKHPSWIVFKYTSDIHKWIANAEIVITQQGVTASTARLAYEKPTIIVYNPRVTLGAPRRDVEIYAEKLEAVYLEKPDSSLLKKAIENPVQPRRRYPSGAVNIAETLLRHLEE